MLNETEQNILNYIKQNRVLVLDGGREYYRQIVFENNTFRFEAEGTGEDWRTLFENDIIILLFNDAKSKNLKLKTVDELYKHYCYYPK
jgi:hypothetical protein